MENKLQHVEELVLGVCYPNFCNRVDLEKAERIPEDWKIIGKKEKHGPRPMDIFASIYLICDSEGNKIKVSRDYLKLLLNNNPDLYNQIIEENHKGPDKWKD